MASDPDLPGSIYRWIEKKPFTDAIKWTPRENFWLMTAACNFGTTDWKSVSQVLKNSGEAYRPKEWYTTGNCERQFRYIMFNATKDLKAMSPIDMMQHIAGNLQKDYIEDALKSKETLKAKYCKLFNTMNRVKQGNLSRQEVVNLYSQARRYDSEGKHYVDQLMLRQNASLTSENLSSGLLEEPIKWNTPSAPLLTSLLRSRNTIPVNRPVTSITSLLQSPPGSISRTRSGKLLQPTTNVKIIQGTPTLSKLLEAPANPYIPKPSQSIQKIKQNDLTDKLVGNTSKKENSQSTSSSNKEQVDNITIPESSSQINKFDLSTSKSQSVKSPVSVVKNGSKANSNIGNVMSDSENDEDGKNLIQNIPPKNLFGEKKDVTSNKVETRATRSQTRAEESFKQLNDSKLSDGKKDQETLREQSGESQLTEGHSIDELIDIDRIEIEPLPSVQDVKLNQTVSKTTRSSTQRPRSLENLSTTRVNTKKISNQMLEEISANFVSNSSIKNIASEYKNVMVGQSRIENANISAGCLIPIDSSSVVKDTIILRKDGQSFQNTANTLSTFDGKLLRQSRIIELKGTNIRCMDSINDPQFISFTNQPIVVVNKIKTPFNIKLSDLNDIKVANNDPKKPIEINNSSQNFVQILDDNCSFSDEIIIIEDDVNINADNSTLTKAKEFSSNLETQDLPLKVAGVNNSSTLSDNSKSTDTQLDEKKLNDKTSWNMFGKTKNTLNVPSKMSNNQHTISKIGNIINIKETNNRLVKELDFDFDQSISQTSLSELYNGVEEIVEMHSFDNEELNSLIECGSSGNKTGVRKNPISLDQGDSFVSESDSTIGAFDTFAQITGVPQKISPKDIKSASKDSTAVKNTGKDLERDESFVQSEEIDDESCSIVSVTGIPILQGVISDVMSKIDSDRVAALNAVDLPKAHVTDIVEISSDEDVEILDDDDEFSNDEGTHSKTSINKFNNIKLKQNICKINHETAKETLNIIKQIEKSISNRNKLITVNKFDTTRVKRVRVVRKSEGISETYGVENIESKKEIELEVNKNKKEELKVVGDNVDRLLPFNEIQQENKLKEAEIKEAKEVELKIILEEKLQCESALNNVRDTKEQLPGEAEEKKKNEDEKMKVKEVEEKEFESETMKRFQETETKIEIEKELKTNEINEVKDAEMKKAKESELQVIKEAELLKIAREKEEEEEAAIKVRENRELEIRKTKEAEIQQAKEAELQIAREVEIQKAKEAETQRFLDAEMKKAKEAEAQKAKEEEMRIVKEAESKKIKEAELIEAKATEIRRAKEAEISKIKEDELGKAIEIEQKNALEVEMKEKEIIARVREVELNKIEEMKINEVEKNKKTTREMEVSKLINDEKTNLNNIVVPKEDLIPSKKFKKMDNEQLMLEPKKTNVQEIVNKESEVEGSKLKKQESKKVIENEEKKGQETEIKIFTRTRGLKPEEKCEDDCNVVSKNVFINSSSSIKSLEQSSLSVSLTNVESPTSIHDSSKQIKHLDRVNTRKTSDTNLKELCDKNTNDSIESSSESAKKEIGQLFRTRSSSSLKQYQQLEIKLAPYNSNCNVSPTSKTTREIKTRVSTATDSNLQSNSETIKMESSAKALLDSKCGKQLTVSVVMLSANEVTIHKEKGDQRSDGNSVKQFENKVHNNEQIIPPKINPNKRPAKPSPRRGGRKRRFDVRNDQTQQAKRYKTTFQNGPSVISKSSTNEGESLPKRTRRSVESSESKNESNEKPSEDKKYKKEVLKMVFNNICDTNKYLPILERQVSKDTSIENLSVVKLPVELKDIKKKICTGEITKIGDIQMHLLVMSYNAVMINRSDTIVFNDAANFQTDLKDNCLVYQKSNNSLNNDDDDHELYNKKRRIIDSHNNFENNKHANDSNNHVCEHSDSDDFSDTDDDSGTDDEPDTTILAFHNRMPVDELLKCIDSSSDEFSDTERDNSRENERKYTFYDNVSDSGEDSDKLDYSWIF